MSSKARKGLLIYAFIFALLLIAAVINKFLVKPVDLVTGFPETPIYSDARLIESAKDPREDIIFDAKWETDASLPEVTKWYLERLHSEGWILDVPPADTNAPDFQYASLTKDNFYVLHISFVKNPSGKTEIITEYLRWVDSEKEGKFINGEFVEDEEE